MRLLIVTSLALLAGQAGAAAAPAALVEGLGGLIDACPHAGARVETHARQQPLPIIAGPVLATEVAPQNATRVPLERIEAIDQLQHISLPLVDAAGTVIGAITVGIATGRL